MPSCAVTMNNQLSTINNQQSNKLGPRPTFIKQQSTTNNQPLTVIPEIMVHFHCVEDREHLSLVLQLHTLGYGVALSKGAYAPDGSVIVIVKPFYHQEAIHAFLDDIEDMEGYSHYVVEFGDDSIREYLSRKKGLKWKPLEL